MILQLVITVAALLNQGMIFNQVCHGMTFKHERLINTNNTKIQ